MKTLIIGAGPLGVFYAHQLTAAGNDVTLLARGDMHERLSNQQFTLKNGITSETVVPKLRVTDSISAEDKFDLTIVIAGSQYLLSIIETLKDISTKSILFMGNNVSGIEVHTAHFDSETILFGFPAAGGGWVGNTLEIADRESAKAKRIPVRIGEIDGQIRPRTRKIEELFASSNQPVEIVADIDGWLKYHGAFVIPMGMAIYRHQGDMSALAVDNQTIRLVIRAAREAGNVLQKLGYTKRQPFRFNLFYWLPEALTAFTFKRLFQSRFAEVAYAKHAKTAHKEFEKLADDFESLAKQAELEMPNWQLLRKKG